MKRLNNRRSRNSAAIGLAVIAVLTFSCSDMFDNIKKYASSETIYVEKLDGIVRVQYGYERVEIDLLQAGRIPSSSIVMNKAKKTVIECPDFTEPDHRRVIDSICSWVNVTGLTQWKNYKLTIYTEDEFGNRSLPIETEVKPYTAENRDALDLLAPKIIGSTSAALVEWNDRLSVPTHTVYSYLWGYTDRDGVQHTGGGEGDMPSFLVENVEKGKDLPVVLTCRIVPTIANPNGTFTAILDTIDWQPTLVVHISEDAEPAIFLKSPEPVFDVNIDPDGSVFPLIFSWAKTSEASGYTLKISDNPDFPAATAYTVDVGNVDEYAMNADEGIPVINSFFNNTRQKSLYWTVVAQGVSANNQVRRLDVSFLPVLVGRWLFDNESNLAAATVGQDLTPVGGGFTPVAGPTASNKAVRIDRGSYYKWLHPMEEGTFNYTIRFVVKFPSSGTHALLQTNPSNTDNAELMLNVSGLVGLDGMGYAESYYGIGPDQWHEIVFVSAGNAKRIYVDGEAAYSTTSNNARYTFYQSELLFFADGSSRDNDLDIAEISVWNMDLTIDEIHQAAGLRKLSQQGWSITDFSAEGAGRVAWLINGSLGNGWYIDIDPPHYAVIDLGAPRNIGRIVAFTSTWTAANPRTVQVLLGNSPSASAAGWTPVGEIVRGGMSWDPWGVLMCYDFPETSVVGRYLQFYMPDRYGTYNALYEVFVYEKE